MISVWVVQCTGAYIISSPLFRITDITPCTTKEIPWSSHLLVCKQWNNPHQNYLGVSYGMCWIWQRRNPPYITVCSFLYHVRHVVFLFHSLLHAIFSSGLNLDLQILAITRENMLVKDITADILQQMHWHYHYKTGKQNPYLCIIHEKVARLVTYHRMNWLHCLPSHVLLVFLWLRENTHTCTGLLCFSYYRLSKCWEMDSRVNVISGW